MAETNRANPSVFSVDTGNVRTLRTVFHVTHIRAAVDILLTGRISSRPVYDESVLNQTRIHVVWLSPNDWRGAGGSRYGTIAFEFEWGTITSMGSYYWVGTMEEYNPTALRFLISEIASPKQLGLLSYDPTTSGGGWVLKNSEHQWNGDQCLEIMVERDLNLTTAKSLKCTRHHDKRCCLDKAGACREAGWDVEDAAPRFVAAVVGGGVPHRGLFADAEGAPTRLAQQGWGWLKLFGEKHVQNGNVRATDPAASALARGALAAYAADRDGEALSLISLFETRDAWEEAATTLLERGLGLSSGALGP